MMLPRKAVIATTKMLVPAASAECIFSLFRNWTSLTSPRPAESTPTRKPPKAVNRKNSHNRLGS